MSATYNGLSYGLERAFDDDYIGATQLRISKLFRGTQHSAEIEYEQDVHGATTMTYRMNSAADCPKAKVLTLLRVQSTGRANIRVETLPKNGTEFGFEADVDAFSGNTKSDTYTIFGKFMRPKYAITGNVRIPRQAGKSPSIEKTFAYTFGPHFGVLPIVGARVQLSNGGLSGAEASALFRGPRNNWALLKIDRDASFRFTAVREIDQTTDVGVDATWGATNPVSLLFQKYLPNGREIKAKVSNKGRFDGVYQFPLGQARIALSAAWGVGSEVAFGARLTL
jgi:hypothetical protein